MLYSSNQRRTLILILLVCLGLFILFTLRDFFTAILGSVILYVLFKPLYLYFTVHKRWNPSLVCALIFFLSFLVLLLPVFSLTWLLFQKTLEWKSDPAPLNHLLDSLNQLVGHGLNRPDMGRYLVNNLEEWLLGAFPSALSIGAKVFLQLVIMYFVLYFMFLRHRAMEQVVLRYMPFPENRTLHFARQLKLITNATVFGHGIIAVVQGVLLFLGFLLFGIPDALLWGVVALMMGFLPFIGPPVIFLPAGIILLSGGHAPAGWGIMLYGLVVISLVEYFLRFYVARKIGNLHPLITGLGIIVGLSYFGIIGFVIGPILLSYFLLLFELYENDFLIRNRGPEGGR